MWNAQRSQKSNWKAVQKFFPLFHRAFPRSLIPQYQDLGSIILAQKHLHAHARTLKHTDLISTWKQILLGPPELCAQLSWWLHLVYISLELNHDLERGCCLSQICRFPSLLLIRHDYWNNASNCALKAPQGERSRADMHTCKFRNKKQLSGKLSLIKTHARRSRQRLRCDFQSPRQRLKSFCQNAQTCFRINILWLEN